MSAPVPVDGYDRAALAPTVVHIGPGVFHRAHQAVYCDSVLQTGSATGAIHAISLRSSAVRDALASQDFVYHVVERGSDASGTAEVRRVGAILGIDVVEDGVESGLARLTDPAVTVVTITVSERGYCALSPGGSLDVTRPEIVHDLHSPRAPRSLPGLLLEALVRRRAGGAAPFTIASCDNLPANGASTARVVRDLAECRDPTLAEWVRGNVAFPSSMVDRMVPATSAEDRAWLRSHGIDDAWPVVTEPFTQWVLEDVFPAGRPAWERAGVELVSSVAAHEQAKLRVLNAAHSALAYWGLLAGHRFVADAAADRVLLDATRDLLEREVLTTLEPPPGWDLTAYADRVLARFANGALGYTTAKVAGDGSQKLPVRLVPTVRAQLGAGAFPIRCTQVLAAWVACVAGPRAGSFAVQDDAIATVCHRATDPATAAEVLLGLPGFLDPGRPGERELAARVAALATAMWRGDIHDVLRARKAEERWTS